jgi:hypothetical protein
MYHLINCKDSSQLYVYIVQSKFHEFMVSAVVWQVIYSFNLYLWKAIKEAMCDSKLTDQYRGK